MTVGSASLSCVASLCRAASPEQQFKDTVLDQAELTPSLPLWELEGAGLTPLSLCLCLTLGTFACQGEIPEPLVSHCKVKIVRNWRVL